MRGATGRSRGQLTARGGAVLAAVLMAGMIPGAQASAGERDVQVELGYDCDFPSGSEPVEVTVSATVPDRGDVDQPVQVRNVTTELTLPEGAVPDLPDAGAGGLDVTTELTVDVAQGEQSAVTLWAGSTGKPVTVPASGGLTLTTSGEVPTVTAGASGALTFAAAKLTARIAPPASQPVSPSEPDSEPDSEPADGAAAPGTVELTCTLKEGQDPALASVRIGGNVTWPSPAASATRERQGTAEDRNDTARNDDGATPEPGGAPAVSQTLGGKGPTCIGDENDGMALNAYVTGYADVAKLKSATLFPLACAKIAQGPNTIKFVDGRVHLFQDSTVVLDYKGEPKLPPATGTFLTFGFMPTTASLEMTQIPPGTTADGKPDYNIHSDLMIVGPGNSEGVTTIDMDLRLRLYNVKVNGVPLDVGPNCRTTKPFKLPLRGEMLLKDGVQTGYTLVTGGELNGEVTLPPFSGCGVDEDLDRLFTASISGVPGAVKQVQGAPCAAAQHDPAVCTSDGQPVQVPEPPR